MTRQRDTKTIKAEEPRLLFDPAWKTEKYHCPVKGCDKSFSDLHSKKKHVKNTHK